MYTTKRGFTLVELIVVIAIIGMLAAIIITVLSGTQLEARDKRRVADLAELRNALNQYANDHGIFPREADGMNGDTATNATFVAALKPYLNGLPHDPVGIGDATYYYYYDGHALCGSTYYAIIFARQMDKATNSNYSEYLNTSCQGTIDGEGRGGGTGSYTLQIGPSGG